jgi:hypothetical protein
LEPFEPPAHRRFGSATDVDESAHGPSLLVRFDKDPSSVLVIKQRVDFVGFDGRLGDRPPGGYPPDE